MNYFIIITLLITSYLLGSIPSGYLLVKYVKNTDIRNEGSNSTGATNTTRVLGLKYGFIALILDVLKGILLMIILVTFKLEKFYIINNVNILALYGLTAVIGHVFPIFLNFKGGKAVATSFGVLTFISPLLGLIAIVIFIITVKISKYISLGSIVSSLCVVLLALILSIFKVELFRGLITPNLNYIPLSYALVLCLLEFTIIIKHQSNIKRIINKTENKFSLKK